jgi:hypothetical protein
MPSRSGLECRHGPANGAVPGGRRRAESAAEARHPSIWYGAVRIGLSLLWDSPEKSWYRRVPP